MPPPDEFGEFADAIVEIVRDLVLAHRLSDPAVSSHAYADALARLLKITAAYAHPEKERDRAAGRAITRTWR